MKFKILLIGTIWLLAFHTTLAQQWVRIFSDTTANIELSKVIEHYDKGYLFSGEKYRGWTYFGHIQKTDINGNKQWSKSYGKLLQMNQFTSVRKVSSGGLVLSGSTNQLESGCTDPILIKINDCGEKVWCKIYNSQGCNSWMKDIVTTPDSGYIALIDRWKSGEEQRVWHFNLTTEGEVVWVQTYATNPQFWSELSHSLVMTYDSNVIITGEAYYPDPTYPGKSIIKIILIKVALDGTSVFEVPWGTNNGVYSDGRQSVVDSKNNIYTAGRRARTTTPGGDAPCLFKTSKNGEPVFYKDLKSTSSLGISTSINRFQDSSLVLCMGWDTPSGNDTTGVIRTDSLGNILNEKTLLVNAASGVFSSDITYNNRVILTGTIAPGGWIQTYAFKLTPDLQYDSVYTRPFTYDCLCPHPIVSDTITLDDCEVVIVGLDDAEKHPEKTRLNIYPNPGGEQVTIVMPQYLVRQNPGSILSSTTTYFQWNKTRLDILSMTGKLRFTHEVPKQQSTFQINTSAWPAGMYFARVVFMNESVAEGKTMVIDD
jgi:hypothetical protein